MATKAFTPLKGRCTCETIVYEVLAPFIVVQCCHCTWCQRENGTAFALNAWIETSNFRVISPAKPFYVDTISASGRGQMMARCPNCYTILYSDSPEDRGVYMVLVRVGTLDDEGKRIVKPDVHIFTSTKLDWVDLSGEKERGVPIMEQRYKRAQVLTKEANERYDAVSKMEDAAKAAKKAKEEIKT